jgi:Rod binding domain-containing protein
MSMKASALAAAQNAQMQSAPDASDRPRNPEEAAAQFEKVLVRQFVEVMTKDLMSSSMAGDGGPGWMNSQRDSQRDHLTDVLTDHLVESGTLDIREMLLKRWGHDDASTDTAPTEGTPTNLPAGLSQG